MIMMVMMILHTEFGGDRKLLQLENGDVPECLYIAPIDCLFIYHRCMAIINRAVIWLDNYDCVTVTAGYNMVSNLRSTAVQSISLTFGTHK